MAAESEEIPVETNVVERFEMPRAVRWHEQFGARGVPGVVRLKPDATAFLLRGNVRVAMR
jgi:hypothetical protein